jgi:hypothetical protein
MFLQKSVMTDLYVELAGHFDLLMLKFLMTFYHTVYSSINIIKSILMNNVPSKPGIQLRKSWCLLSSSWAGLDNREGAAIFEKGP